MRHGVTLSAILAVALAHAVSQDVPVLGGAELPDPERVCTKAGEKCGGVADFPAVAYQACCDTRLICAVPKAIPAGLWGRFCIFSADTIDAPVVTSAVPSSTVKGGTNDQGASTTAAIAGGVIFALVLITSVGLLCFCVGKRGRDRWNEKPASGVNAGSGRAENWVDVMGIDPPPLAAVKPDITTVAVGGEVDRPDGRGGSAGMRTGSSDGMGPSTAGGC
jgi:hypothetical protein